MGAFQHADLAGLDLIASDAARAVWADRSNATDSAKKQVGEMQAQGKLGMTTGQGFYNLATRDADALICQRDEEIIRRVKINRGAKVSL